MESIESSRSSLDLFLHSIESALFYDEHIRSVYEVTYAYYVDENTGFAYNKTLFDDVCGIKQCDFSLESYSAVVRKIESLLDIMHQKQQELDNYSDDEKYPVIKKSLRYHEMLLQLTFFGLPFEAEKAGLDVGLTVEEREQRIRKQKEIDRLLFDGLVSEDTVETSNSYHYLYKIFEKGKRNLTLDEQKIFSNYLDRIAGLETYDPAAIQDTMTPREDYAIINEKLKSITLSRDEYVRLFELAFEFFDINKDVLVEERSSIYDGPNALAIPSSAGYQTRDAHKILSLILHEIGTHYITDENNILGPLRGGWYLPKEEGLATISEKLFAGISLEDINGFSVSQPALLMGEVLEDHKEYKNFYYLYNKLQGKSDNGLSATLRKTRNMGSGVVHKDVVYSRGQKKVADFLQNGGNIIDLYAGKLDFDDLALTHHQMKLFLIPYMLADIIAYKLNGGLLDKHSINDFLCKKYPFFADTIRKQDLLSLEKKQIIVQMLDVFDGASS